MIVIQIPEIVRGLIAAVVFIAIYVPVSIFIGKRTKRSNDRMAQRLKEHEALYKDVIRANDNLAGKLYAHNQLLAESNRLKEQEKWNIRLLRQEVKDLVKAAGGTIKEE